ncbi:hypothetical protein QQF64_012274 [Cirrhinus molitorella]|uniref:Uncharacterized protein n=1 Tax=Cirrhinus molitorella TaxID=172907 RepID=A0ABR3LV25_9TELE
MVMLSSLFEQHFLTGESTGQVATLQAVPSTEHTALGQGHRMAHCHLPTSQHTTTVSRSRHTGSRARSTLTTTDISTDAWALRVAATEMHIA